MTLRKISYISLYQAQDMNQWSGTPYFQTKALAEHNLHIDYYSLSHIAPSYKIKMQYWLQKYVHRTRPSLRYNLALAQQYAHFLAPQLEQSQSDFILSPQVQPLAYLETKQPLILWTDALFASLVGFYAPSSSLSKEYILSANEITRACLARCHLAIFASEWAALGAIHHYGIAKEKVAVIPLGANLNAAPTLEEVREFIKKRSHQTIQLLFIGKDWHRKGGDIVLAVANALHAAHYPVQLHVVGCDPKVISNQPLPAYVRCYGFIDKQTATGQATLKHLLSISHFFFMPSRSDCYGVVYAEASAFGVPSLASFVGGIETVVKDGINGQTFALTSTITTYCDYITTLFADRTRYEALALSSYDAYKKRLNWQVATTTLLSVIKERL